MSAGGVSRPWKIAFFPGEWTRLRTIFLVVFYAPPPSYAKSEFSATVSSIPHDDRKPIGSALSGAAPVAHFKRLYQKCSGRDLARCSSIFFRSTSDRDLTFTNRVDQICRKFGNLLRNQNDSHGVRYMNSVGISWRWSAIQKTTYPTGQTSLPHHHCDSCCRSRKNVGFWTDADQPHFLTCFSPPRTRAFLRKYSR